LQPKRIADGDDHVPNFETVIFGQCQRSPLHPFRRRDLDHGQVGLRVGCDNLGARPHAVVEVDDHLLRSCNDMVVGDDVAFVVVDEARSLTALQRQITFRQRETGDLRQRAGAACALYLDVDDGRRNGIVERGQCLLIAGQAGIVLQHRRSERLLRAAR